MPQVEIVITKGLSYATRRLTAGDRITVSEQDAKVLCGIGKAERARSPGRIAAPPPELLDRAARATTPPAQAPEPAAVSAMSTATIAPAKPARRKRSAKKAK